MKDLLHAFAPNLTPGRPLDMSNLYNVAQIAQSLGIASLSEQGAHMFAGGMGGSLEDGGGGGGSPELAALEALLETLGALGRGGNATRAHRRASGSRRSNTPAPTPSQARKELQFYAMLLAPHQVELLFVLCTLLSGRRKIDVQRQLAELGLADILVTMFDRMSWESPPFKGPNPLEHIHGPGCECNPESAQRVQFLRLVHNFYDRDFLGNANKRLILSTAERELMELPVNAFDERVQDGLFLQGADRGLLSRITKTLQGEAADSVYRYLFILCIYINNIFIFEYL